jgi:hypothetical protein
MCLCQAKGIQEMMVPDKLVKRPIVIYTVKGIPSGFCIRVCKVPSLEYSFSVLRACPFSSRPSFIKIYAMSNEVLSKAPFSVQAGYQFNQSSGFSSPWFLSLDRGGLPGVIVFDAQMLNYTPVLLTAPG